MVAHVRVRDSDVVCAGRTHNGRPKNSAKPGRCVGLLRVGVVQPQCFLCLISPGKNLQDWNVGQGQSTGNAPINGMTVPSTEVVEG